jgi:hypothetical protein
MFRSLDLVGYWSADNNFGEMFYNFWLHETLRNLCGADLTRIFTKDMTESQKTLWDRCLMGMRGQHDREQPMGRKAHEEGCQDVWGKSPMGPGHGAVSGWRRIGRFISGQVM